MTTATLTRGPASTARPGYSFRSATRMEWLKLRSVRSTSWILLVFAAGMIGLSVLVLSHEHWATMSAADRSAFDPTNEGFTGLALGLGALVRNTAAAISAVVGMLFVVPLILLPLGTSIQNSVGQFLPMLIAENSMTAVKPVAHSLSPGVGFGVLCLYAVIALAVGAWALARRDA